MALSSANRRFAVPVTVRSMATSSATGGVPVLEVLLVRQLSLGDGGEHVEQPARRGMADAQAFENNRAHRDACGQAAELGLADPQCGQPSGESVATADFLLPWRSEGASAWPAETAIAPLPAKT